MLKRETWIITFVMCLLAGLTGTATMNAEEIAPDFFGFCSGRRELLPGCLGHGC